MKKTAVLLIGISLLMVLGYVVTGCGQATPQISTSSSQPKGLTIRGTVYGTTSYWDNNNSTLMFLETT